jgi:hypothetical protein
MNGLSSSGVHWRTSLYGLFAVTVLNYLAQIPYYIHFYGIHHAAPSLLGLTLLGLTFAVFLAGFVLTLRHRRSGWWLLLGFLALEFAFYVVHDLSGAFLKDLPVSDPLFLAVSLIGYLNTVAALVYLIVLIRGHHHVAAAVPAA